MKLHIIMIISNLKLTALLPKANINMKWDTIAPMSWPLTINKIMLKCQWKVLKHHPSFNKLEYYFINFRAVWFIIMYLLMEAVHIKINTNHSKLNLYNQIQKIQEMEMEFLLMFIVHKLNLKDKLAIKLNLWLHLSHKGITMLAKVWLCLLEFMYHFTDRQAIKMLIQNINFNRRRQNHNIELKFLMWNSTVKQVITININPIK